MPVHHGPSVLTVSLCLSAGHRFHLAGRATPLASAACTTRCGRPRHMCAAALGPASLRLGQRQPGQVPLLARVGRLRTHCVCWTALVESAQWPETEMKNLFIFLDWFELIETLKIHNSLFKASKIMKLVLWIHNFVIYPGKILYKTIAYVFSLFPLVLVESLIKLITCA
jgi:hypothetical protein